MPVSIYNLDSYILKCKSMSITDYLDKRKKENEKRKEEAKYAEIATKAIRLAYFYRTDYPEQYAPNAKAGVLATLNSGLENTTVARMEGVIPIKLHLADWRVYFEWLYSLPPYQPYINGAFGGQKPNGPSMNMVGIEVPRLSDIMLILISIIMTPRNSSGDYTAIKKELKTASAKSYVKYLEQQKINIYLGPAINDSVALYFINYFAIMKILSSTNPGFGKNATVLDKQKDELIIAKVIKQVEIDKLVAQINIFAKYGLVA